MHIDFVICKKLKRDLKNFQKKQKNENFQQSHSAEKSERRDPLGFFNIRYVAKYQEKMKGGIFGDMKKNCEKSQSRNNMLKIWSRERLEPTSF